MNSKLIILILLLVICASYINNKTKGNTSISFIKHVHRTNKFNKDTYSTVMEADIYQVTDTTGNIHIVVVPVVDWIKEDQK